MDYYHAKTQRRKDKMEESMINSAGCHQAKIADCALLENRLDEQSSPLGVLASWREIFRGKLRENICLK